MRPPITSPATGRRRRRRFSFLPENAEAQIAIAPRRSASSRSTWRRRCSCIAAGLNREIAGVIVGGQALSLVLTLLATR
jgi:hypothetical protein